MGNAWLLVTLRITDMILTQTYISLHIKESKIFIDGTGGSSGEDLRVREDSVDGNREEALETMIGLQEEEVRISQKWLSNG